MTLLSSFVTLFWYFYSLFFHRNEVWSFLPSFPSFIKGTAKVDNDSLGTRVSAVGGSIFACKVLAVSGQPDIENVSVEKDTVESVEKIYANYSYMELVQFDPKFLKKEKKHL